MSSTAIPNIYTKDIVEILVEVKDFSLAFSETKIIIHLLNNRSRVSFNNVYTVYQFSYKVLHINLRIISNTDGL